MKLNMRYQDAQSGREEVFEDAVLMQAVRDLKRAWLQKEFNGMRLRRETAEKFALGWVLPYAEAKAQYWSVVDMRTTENPTPCVEVEFPEARYAEIMEMHARLIKITTPDADPIGTAKARILALPVGRQHGTDRVVVQREQDAYRLVAVWLLPEIHDEDPGSVGCGCPLQGQSHAHAEKPYALADIDTLAADFIAAKSAIASHRQVAFARGERIGG